MFHRIRGATSSIDRCAKIAVVFLYPLTHFAHNQLQKTNHTLLTPANTAPVGIDSKCGIPFLSPPHSLGNVANVILCGISFFVVLFLISIAVRRKAAVGACGALVCLFLSAHGGPCSAHRAALFPHTVPHLAPASTYFDVVIPSPGVDGAGSLHGAPCRYCSSAVLVFVG